ncbi:tetratricopeptide repeat protein 1 isoform X2 [Denticeps clupeoides]|uniref:tetratricopeptide repeat protein 1 isoform X2 n=1 Tax=Denticeps clupeoides TaxID=299321 RepID=UPI0010A40CEA|nr:tetratricopeptide repeat protein 1 isoform X2 [Denticeps clupeoides]
MSFTTGVKVMDAASEAFLNDCLRVSEQPSQSDKTSPAKQDNDFFYDCEETLDGEDTASPSIQTEGETVSHLEGDDSKRKERLKSMCASAETETLSAGLQTLGVQEKNKGREGAQERSEEFAEQEKSQMSEEWDEAEPELKEGAAKVAEFDDEYLKEVEKDLTEEEKEARRKESLALKEKGNDQFKKGEYSEAEESYTAALHMCPVVCSKERSVLFSNRAAARLHLDKKEEAICDCTKAIELNPGYVRAILRRAELYEKTDKLDEALEDYKNVVEKDPGIPSAREACMRLPQQIQERNEKLKEEMMSMNFKTSVFPLVL